MLEKTRPTRADYDTAFGAERSRAYPVVDEFESRCGYSVDRDRLERAARVLACPVKVNPPNWQHGRVIYAVLRKYLEGTKETAACRCLDVGTAKGFSALVASWAIEDAGRRGHVSSVDVIDPSARVFRNTVAEVLGPKTLAETLADFPEAAGVEFKMATGVQWLTFNRRPLDFVFVDGKHSYAAVSQELNLVRSCQLPGAVLVCDDIQVPGVRKAVEEQTRNYYDVEFVEVLDNRGYAVCHAVG